MKDFKQWFKQNPEGLRENVIPKGSNQEISRPIPITAENIISHKDTITSYLAKLEEGMLVPYYTAKIEEYISEYDKLKQS